MPSTLHFHDLHTLSNTHHLDIINKSAKYEVYITVLIRQMGLLTHAGGG